METVAMQAAPYAFGHLPAATSDYALADAI
jgi:hypothetical protein